jgi:hypothetical protein
MGEHAKVFHHVGLLVNEPSSDAGVPFIKSSDKRMIRVQPDTTSGFFTFVYYFDSCARDARIMTGLAASDLYKMWLVGASDKRVEASRSEASSNPIR